jgi:hypothetical protein
MRFLTVAEDKFAIEFNERRRKGEFRRDRNNNNAEKQQSAVVTEDKN